MPEISGVLPVNKPAGISSFDVIRQVSKKIRVKKIGHGGTLDLAASGVLLLLLGEATKLFDFLLKTDKIYRADIQFGMFTETDDAEGEVTEQFDKSITLDELSALLPGFTGVITQIPPKYSALKTGGIRNYSLARRDMDVPEKPREVEIKSFVIDSFDPATQEAAATITCSSGTYIRAIARDLGKALGCGAYLAGLLRLKSGGIELARCKTIEEIGEDNLPGILIGLNDALSHIPALELTVPPEHILNGKPLTNSSFSVQPPADGIYRAVGENRLLALVDKTPAGIKYLRVFTGT